jgi:hypothetical protein
MRVNFPQGKLTGEGAMVWSPRTLRFNDGGVTKLKTAVRYRAA